MCATYKIIILALLVALSLCHRSINEGAVLEIKCFIYASIQQRDGRGIIHLMGGPR